MEDEKKTALMPNCLECDKNKGVELIKGQSAFEQLFISSLLDKYFCYRCLKSFSLKQEGKY